MERGAPELGRAAKAPGGVTYNSGVTAHGRDVHRFLIATVGHSDADDCYQETWLAALRAYPRLRHAQNLRSWIFTVAHRKVIDHVRARRRRALPVGDVPEPAPVQDVTRLSDDAVWGHVRGLPDKQRTAVFLRFAADLDYAQIGQALECSEPAARQNVRAGLATIRKGWARA